MRVLLSTFLLALWSLYVWVFDPFHIEDRLLTDVGSFLYWLIGAVLSIALGLALASLWGKR